jgi:hypothetical protein
MRRPISNRDQCGIGKGGGRTLIILTSRDLRRSASAVGSEKETTTIQCLWGSRISPYKRGSQRKPVEQRGRWIEKHWTTATALRIRRQPERGQGSRDSGRVPRKAIPVAHGEGQRTDPGTCTTAANSKRTSESVASAANLAQALLNELRNKGASGADGQTVEEVAEQAPHLLPKLQAALLKGTYRPGEIRRVWIPKPGGGQRGLGIPNVVDRWVQQAVLQIVEPIFEPTFTRAVTDSVRTEALRPPLRKQKNTSRRDIESWWISTYRNFRSSPSESDGINSAFFGEQAEAPNKRR